eukprot:15478951-Alexandrium_andersonii.AAC.1
MRAQECAKRIPVNQLDERARCACVLRVLPQSTLQRARVSAREIADAYALVSAASVSPPDAATHCAGLPGDRCDALGLVLHHGERSRQGTVSAQAQEAVLSAAERGRAVFCRRRSDSGSSKGAAARNT